MAIEIVSFPIQNAGSFHSYVSLPEGSPYDSHHLQMMFHYISSIFPISTIFFLLLINGQLYHPPFWGARCCRARGSGAGAAACWTPRSFWGPRRSSAQARRVKNMVSSWDSKGIQRVIFWDLNGFNGIELGLKMLEKTNKNKSVILWWVCQGLPHTVGYSSNSVETLSLKFRMILI